MKLVNGFCLSAGLAVLLLLPVGAWSEIKGPMYLAHPTSVAGKMLASGEYTVRWEGNGEQVEVHIYHGKNELATVPARVIQLSSPAGFNSAVVENGGSQALTEIRFQGKKFALRIGENSGKVSSAAAAK